jgi:hypothetical protein
MPLKPHSLRSNKFLLLGHHKWLSNRPLLPKAFQQEALLPNKVEHQWKHHRQHQIFKQSSQAFQHQVLQTQEQ